MGTDHPFLITNVLCRPVGIQLWLKVLQVHLQWHILISSAVRVSLGRKTIPHKCLGFAVFTAVFFKMKFMTTSRPRGTRIRSTTHTDLMRRIMVYLRSIFSIHGNSHHLYLISYSVCLEVPNEFSPSLPLSASPVKMNFHLVQQSSYP